METAAVLETPDSESARRLPAFTGPAFDLRVTEAGRMALARVQGPLDAEFSIGFLQWLRPLCGHSQRVVVDLRRATYLDSSGVRALLILRDELEAAQAELRLVVLPGSDVDRALQLLHLQHQFLVYDRAADAWLQRTLNGECR